MAVSSRAGQVDSWPSGRAHRAHHEQSAFPLLLTLGFLAATLLLLVTSTVPALHEKEVHKATEADLVRIKGELDRLLAGWRGREAAMDHDVETLLVEIDRLNLTPDELSSALAREPSPQLPEPQLRHPQGRTRR